MIVLITGASHTGKTVLSQRLLEKRGWPYLSIDHLKMGLIRSGQTKLTPCDDDELTEYLWPIVREIRFVCLALSDGYIDANFSKIKEHASDIEARLDDSDCTMESVKAGNQEFAQKFQTAGEEVVFVDGEYEKVLETFMK